MESKRMDNMNLIERMVDMNANVFEKVCLELRYEGRLGTAVMMGS